MKIGGTTRRRFLLGALASAPFLVCADAAWLEPDWVKVHHQRIGQRALKIRLVHITDIHHKGDAPYLQNVVRKINALSPDYVFFTGDLVEERRFVTEALAILSGIKASIWGVPGNHDYWSGADFQEIGHSFYTHGGGAFLQNERMMIANGKICLTGATCLGGRPKTAPPVAGMTNILLLHYPLMADRLGSLRYDLLLAGHSHGGQVRIPFYGALRVPYWVGNYQMGLYQTAPGPLYVNPGLGWLGTNIRFCCRPEITVFDI